MAPKREYIFTCEGAWSDGYDGLLCLDTGDWRIERTAPLMVGWR